MISLDLETTGLDPKKDAIIEIGAIKFSGNRVVDEFSTLVNPRKPINAFITNLTGISNPMLQNAPLLAEVLPKFNKFAGNAVIIGHNISFDLSFLQKSDSLLSNEFIDTYELASVLLPTSPRYKLGALAQLLGIPLANAHRATDDARAAMHLYLRLDAMMASLPNDLISEILHLSEGLHWGGELPFHFWAGKNFALQAPGDTKYKNPFLDDKTTRRKPLQPVDNLIPLDVDNLAAVIEAGGDFSRHISGFESRPQQVEMLKAVAKTFSEGEHLLVEAGTGTGKSLAYLIPAAKWALQNEERVVISTNTIALQDQLINKDLPDLVQATSWNLQACVLKGRSNYLCPRRFLAMRRRKPETVDELRVLAKILVWLQSSQSGDRSELNLNGPVERQVWSRLSAEDEGCSTENCLKRMGGRCPYYKAHQAAESAHILIVNHALLLADAATENRVLPAYNYLIVDEGHHLEAATTDAMSFRLRAPDVTRMVRELGSIEQGLFSKLFSALVPQISESERASLHRIIEEATDYAYRFDNRMTDYFRGIDALLEELRDGQAAGTYPQQVRILPSTRSLPVWLDVEVAWERAKEELDGLLKQLNDLRESVRDLSQDKGEEVEDFLSSLGSNILSLKEISVNVDNLTMVPDPTQIYWVELDPLQYRITLQIAPLHIGGLMEKLLWHEKVSVVLTSATLTTHGEFDYLRGRLHADDAHELTLGSPFDYENAAMIYLPSDVPDPSDAYAYQRATEEAIIQLAKATGGRLLALFTSYAQLQKTSKAISGPLARADITVYEQGEGASASALLEIFKETPRSVLLGTRAFWEGVDVPGDALSALVIARLPFDVPSDPIIAARSESFDEPFSEYSLPEAILRFRQGFGRLIRSQSDRGVVLIMDKRIRSKAYGRLFLESLPQCHLVEGRLANLPEKAAKWLGM